jgi:A/G-specific adenine glycosylase
MSAVTDAQAQSREEVWARLLAWYAAEGRAHLPWRHTRDPYAVLVSEVMLQQTQVERVLPKYEEWLRRFPTLEVLAAASAGEAIQGWAGLGYNTRAVRLHAIARQAVAEYGGRLPGTLEGLLALKGIGRYTAGAVACFALGLPVATVDTNIRRVLWRVFEGIELAQWPAGERAAREALQLAEWALPPQHAYDWQQALMDLGATVCVSRRPACERCPLRENCAAYAETAAATLFPSGEALVRIRDERAAGQDFTAEETEGAEEERGLQGGHRVHGGGEGGEGEGEEVRGLDRARRLVAEVREEYGEYLRRDIGRPLDAPTDGRGETVRGPAGTPRRGVGARPASPGVGRGSSSRGRDVRGEGERAPAADDRTSNAPQRAVSPAKRIRRKTASVPFEQTTRYFRGRIVAALRELAPDEALTLAELGPRVKPDYTGADEPWLRALVAGLARDGLALIATGEDGVERVALP